jgi:hypothetical protein
LSVVSCQRSARHSSLRGKADGSCVPATMSQMRLNFLNGFGLALPPATILAFRSIPAVGARIVAIATIAPTANNPRNGPGKLLAFATSARGWSARLQRREQLRGAERAAPTRGSVIRVELHRQCQRREVDLLGNHRPLPGPRTAVTAPFAVTRPSPSRALRRHAPVAAPVHHLCGDHEPACGRVGSTSPDLGTRRSRSTNETPDQLNRPNGCNYPIRSPRVAGRTQQAQTQTKTPTPDQLNRPNGRNYPIRTRKRQGTLSEAQTQTKTAAPT